MTSTIYTKIHLQNGTQSSIVALLNQFSAFVPSSATSVIFPTLLHVSVTRDNLPTGYELGAQNGVAKQGAFTGEVSMDQLKEYGVEWLIVGHSERRAIFGESDEIVSSKARDGLNSGLKVVACLGETEDERENGQTMTVLRRQLNAYLSKIDNWDNVVLAYEPIWAIGTGKTATPEQAEEVHKNLREEIAKTSENIAEKLRIIYGGSVKGSNAKELFSKKNIDGFLVGGASLTDGFLDIIRATSGNSSKL